MNNQAPPAFVPKNASYFRARARELLRGNWGIAIGSMFLALICGAFFTVNLSSSFDFSAEELETVAPFSEEALQLILSKLDLTKFVITLSVSAVLGIVWRIFVGGPVYVGYQKINLDLVDQAPLKIATLFGAFQTSYFRSILLRLLLLLLDWLCSLPTIITGIVGFFVYHPAFKALFVDHVFSWESLALIGYASLIMACGAILSCFLHILVHLNYGFAAVIFAEYPELSPIDALRKSRTLMRGKQWKLFCLECSFIGWYLISFVIGLIWILPYRKAAHIAFYDEIANRRAAEEAEFPSLNPDDYINDETR